MPWLPRARYSEGWDPEKHPRGDHGRFGRTLARTLRHGEVEREVWRDEHGNVLSAKAGRRKAAELMATARRKMDQEDRVGERLRWGEDTKGHWYMIKGPQYWVKEDSKPGWHHGFYYKPGSPFPVVPPRADWESRTSYSGPPGSPRSSVVPDDVWQASQMYPEDRAGKRAVGRGMDRTVRSEKFERRKSRVGLGPTAGEYGTSKQYRARKVTREAAVDDPTSVVEAGFNEQLHPRAAAGSSDGGQFTAGGSSGSASKPAHASKKAAGHATVGRKSAGRGTLAYDPNSDRGPGYGMPHGDPRVHKLQEALNRLGATDGRGRELADDGKLGPLTTQAVKEAQRRLGLPQDGKVTAALMSKLAGLKSLPGTPAHHAAAHRSAPAHKATPKAPAKKKTTAPKPKPAPNTGVHVGSRGYAEAVEDDMTGRVDETTESVINGNRTFAETSDLVRDALKAHITSQTGAQYPYVCIVDISDEDVVWTSADEDDLWMSSYSVGDDNSVELGDPEQVERTYAPVGANRNPPPEGEEPEGAAEDDEPDEAGEAVDRVTGRVVEAKGTDDAGGRVFRVRILAYGDSKNGRRYSEAVMRRAVALYEGAKAYDHHRTQEELRSSTLAGLIGSYRNCEAASDGLYGDLHLLPSATHAAEALDASLAAQADGMPPLVGVSHDVMAHFQPVVAGGRRLQEATQIVGVQSADVVANPSAGGMAVRAVAGGEELPDGDTPAGDESEETDVPVTTESVLDALKTATDEQLGAVGLQRAAQATESTAPTGAPQRAVESGEQRVTEAASYEKSSFIGGLMVKEKLSAAGLTAAVESVTAALPDRFTESDVDAQVQAIKAGLAMVERSGLAPSVVTVAKEAQDKKVERLDAMFAGDFQKGYRSFREAYLDFTGRYVRQFDADLNREILRESFGNGDYEYRATRSTESMTSSSWNLVLGDSVTRRLISDYNEPSLMDWMQIVSSTPPVNDFRTQRIERIGGYGILPTVAQGAPYQPLTSPGNEEITYTLGKRGGTEDVTLEMIANDDIRAISKIPTRLALAAKRTIFDFVFEMIRPSTGTGPFGTAGNPTIYDSVALYASGHANTATNALSQTNLSAARAAMRKQAGYGDAQNILSAIPKFLLVPPTLEELAFQLTTSAVAIPATPAGPSNTPNIHQGLTPIVIDYWDAISSTQWAIVADPNTIPTVEVGFYQGQRDPQLFTQSDPTVGSMFNADKFTYKIRHIYSGAVLEYRGFQRGNS